MKLSPREPGAVREADGSVAGEEPLGVQKTTAEEDLPLVSAAAVSEVSSAGQQPVSTVTSAPLVTQPVPSPSSSASNEVKGILIYTVSRKKVTPCIHCHNSNKQCQILT